MSKAFTKEDDLPEPVMQRRASVLPPMAKNYLTPDGEKKLKAELQGLMQIVSGEASGGSAQTAEQQAQRERIQYLTESLQSAEIVHPPTGPADKIRFGATVKVKEKGGQESQYRIVGVDETDIDRGWVSWLSPVAKALLNKRAGDRAVLTLPDHVEELEILSVDYDPIQD
jgi:transcription elongation factor GreB